MPGVICTYIDQCRIGLKCPKTMKPIKERTTLMSNAEGVAAEFQPLQCTGAESLHKIQESQDGISLARFCQKYTPELCEHLAHAVERTARPQHWNVADVRYPQQATVFLQPLNEGAGWRPPLRCGVREPCPWPCSAGKESENSLNSHCPVVKCCYWLLLLDDKIFDCTHSPCSCKIVVKYLPPVTQHDAVYQVSWINEMLCSCLDILKWGSLRWYLGFYNLGDTSRTSAMTWHSRPGLGIPGRNHRRCKRVQS